MKMKSEKPKSSSSSLLPVMGFVVAIGVAVMAFFLAPELIKLLRGVGLQGMTPASFNAKMRIGAGTTEDIMFTPAHIAFTVMIWFVVFSLLMLVVASALGTKIEDEEVALLRPREDDKKAMKEYYKKLDKHQKRQAERAKEYVKRKEKEAKKK